jgi:hypothetical protein
MVRNYLKKVMTKCQTLLLRERRETVLQVSDLDPETTCPYRWFFVLFVRLTQYSL